MTCFRALESGHIPHTPLCVTLGKSGDGRDVRTKISMEYNMTWNNKDFPLFNIVMWSVA